MSPWHRIWHSHLFHTSASLEICSGVNGVVCVWVRIHGIYPFCPCCVIVEGYFVFQQNPSLLPWSSAWQLELSLLSSSSWEPSVRSAVRAPREVCTSQPIAVLHVHHQKILSAPQSDKEKDVRVFMSLHRNRAFISISSFSLSVRVGLGGMMVKSRNASSVCNAAENPTIETLADFQCR